MLKKLPLLALLLFITTFSLYSQLEWSYNSPRSGDKLIKQRVEFHPPGESGQGILWDFSQLNLLDPEYTLTYHSPELINDSLYILGKDSLKVFLPGSNEELLVAIEHSTMYYYHFRNDSLFLLGHENPHTIMRHTPPQLVMTYPFVFGQTTGSSFQSEGIYTSAINIASHGDLSLYADATGTVILPEADTLRNVTRIHMLKKITEQPRSNSGESSVSDPDSLQLTVETWTWYMNGYRYPVFESVKSTAYKQGKTYDQFSSSYYYPPQEQYYGLSSDLENQFRRDEYAGQKGQKNNKNTKGKSGNGPGTDNPDDNTPLIHYGFSTDSKGKILQLNYNLSEAADVTIMVFDMQGRQLSGTTKTRKERGQYNEQINLSSASRGEYLLRITVDEIVYGELITF